MSKIKGAKRPNHIYYYCLTETYQETGAKPAIVSVTKLNERQILREFQSRHSIGIERFSSQGDRSFDVKVAWDYRGKDLPADWEKGKVLRTRNEPTKATVVGFNNYKRFFFFTINLKGIPYQVRVSDAEVMRLIMESGIAKGGEVLAPVLWELDRGRLRLFPE